MANDPLEQFIAFALLILSCVTSSSAEMTPDRQPSNVIEGKPAVSAHIPHSASRSPFEGWPEQFAGKVRVDLLLSANAPARASAAYVTFEPGARTAWHTHPLGQTLVVTAGSGLVQFWGGPIQRIEPGDVVWIPPGQKHWHGASPSSAMTHLAIQEQLDDKSVDWFEKVTDAQYRDATPGVPAAPGGENAATKQVEPPRAQKLFGDIAPKLADLTDNVLFGDVWERPGLSKRDRSLVTVSALIALNRPDQLRSHLALARENGLKQDELVEAITHLAFYAGWPSAVGAASVAREVFHKERNLIRSDK